MKFATRHRARECAVQAIYSWELSGNSIDDIEIGFFSEQDMSNVDVSYFHELVIGVSNNVSELDKKITPYLFRHIKQLGYIEKSVLRLATFELFYCNDVPYKVIINEAIELAKVFGAEKSHIFINAILDKVVNTARKK
ncbi:MAG: transcription antitermination factor NusB [Arsenophonus sp.]|nr:MAG: transcription antitermination factor NusB [Arsenophonus sp.]